MNTLPLKNWLNRHQYEFVIIDYIECDSCKGRTKQNCKSCNGLGERNIDGTYYDCSKCDGTGERTCKKCKGNKKGVPIFQCDEAEGTSEGLYRYFCNIDSKRLLFNKDLLLTWI